MLSNISILVTCAILATAFGEDLYPDKFDHISAAEILKDDKLRMEYHDCFLDLGPCLTEDAAFFKDYLPEVIATQCRKCTPKQKENFEIVVLWYTENQPEEWEKIVQTLLNKARAMGILSK